MGCCANAPRLLPPPPVDAAADEFAGEEEVVEIDSGMTCLSMRAHVK